MKTSKTTSYRLNPRPFACSVRICRAAAAALLIAASLSGGERASAWDQSTPAASLDEKASHYLHKRNYGEYASWDLSALPGLDGLPAYPGRSPLFVDGMQMPSTRSGSVSNLRLATREDAAMVANWYRDAIKSQGWEVMTGQVGGNAMSAKRDKDTVSIMVMPSNRPGYRAEVVILYKSGR